MEGRDGAAVVVVVDADAGVCRSLERALTGRGYAVETFTSARDYLAVSASLRHDCLIASLRMPDLDGVSMYEASRAAGQEVPTVCITDGTDLPAAVDTMGAAASDVIARPVMTPILIVAIEAAITRSAETREIDRELAAYWTAIATLTPREAEVCALAATGRLNKQIAAALGAAEKTVKVHRARALRKLGTHSIAEVVHIFDAVLSNGARHPPLDEDGHPLPRSRGFDIIARVFSEAAHSHS
jgi:FixJ family two-component response regulator